MVDTMPLECVHRVYPRAVRNVAPMPNHGPVARGRCCRPAVTGSHCKDKWRPTGAATRNLNCHCRCYCCRQRSSSSTRRSKKVDENSVLATSVSWQPPLSSSRQCWEKFYERWMVECRREVEALFCFGAVSSPSAWDVAIEILPPRNSVQSADVG